MRIFIFAVCAALTASPALAQDYSRQSTAASELRQMCVADAGQLWGADLCGPLIVVEPATRQVWATQRDDAGVLTLTAAGGWVGILPAGVPVANSTVEWGGVRWVMVMGPLPEDGAERRVLLAHEAWHRAQDSIGLPMQNATADHLEAERARYLLRLEFRALATAMLSNGRARRAATEDALGFRLARFAAFPDARSSEASLDRNEGLAAYTGVKLGAGAGAALYAARELNNYDNHEAFARSYAYANGPAYGLLLDQYKPDWRRTLAAWAPADLLIGELRVSLPSNRTLLQRAERYGGPQIAAQERARAERQAQVLAELRARFTGPRLELPLAQMQMEYNPQTVTPVEGLGSVYEVLTVRDLWGEFRTSQGALISADFSRLSAANPQAGGLSGPGWVMALAPGYRMSVPDPSGVIRPEFIAPPPPEPIPDN